MSHPVALMPGIQVRGVVHHFDAESAAQILGVGAPQCQQGPAGTGSHGRQSTSSGAAQQVDQDGLGLIIGGVTGEHVGGQHRIAGCACPCLQVRAVTHLHDGGVERNAHSVGQRPDHLRLSGSAGSKLVVDVDRGGVAPCGNRQDEQSRGVGAAGHRTRDDAACGRERGPGEQLMNEWVLSE
jgi:hypothetical protein